MVNPDPPAPPPSESAPGVAPLSVEARRNCGNCGARLEGPFCHRCGQDDLDLDRSLVHFFTEFMGGILNFDSRVWRTVIPLLFRPGEVTAHYLAGRRARFVPPVRLYLFVSLVYFLMLAWLSGSSAVDVGVGLAEIRSDPEIEGFMQELPAVLQPFVPGLARAADDPAVFRKGVIQGVSYLMFVLVPLFGAMLHLLYRNRGRFYLHHLLLAVHIHVVVFLVLAVSLLMDVAGPAFLERVGGMLRLAIPAHLFFTLRTVYGGRIWTTGLRTAALTLAYLLVLALSLAGLVVALLL